jgi:hypothetical protein
MVDAAYLPFFFLRQGDVMMAHREKEKENENEKEIVLWVTYETLKVSAGEIGSWTSVPNK